MKENANMLYIFIVVVIVDGFVFFLLWYPI
jgi:hypothetical protein